MSLLGHKRTNHRRPKSTFVRYCPKADKMLRCVRLLKGEKLLSSRNSASGTRSRSHLCTLQPFVSSLSSSSRSADARLEFHRADPFRTKSRFRNEVQMPRGFPRRSKGTPPKFYRVYCRVDWCFTLHRRTVLRKTPV